MTATKKQPIAGYRISDPSDPTIKPWLSDTPDDNGYTSEPLYAGAAPAAVAPLPAVLEQIAQGWDGCKYDAPGETLDIGADIRAAARRLLAAAAPALEAPAAPGGKPMTVTPEMRAAFRLAYREGGFWNDRLDYALDQMMAAAPQAPAAPSADYNLIDEGGPSELAGAQAQYSIERKDGTTLAWVNGDKAAAEELMAALRLPMPISRAEWIAEVRSFLCQGGWDEPVAISTARDLCEAQDWLGQDIEDPRDAAWNAFLEDMRQAPHSDDLAVDRFAAEMKAKLAAARAKGRGGWETCPPEVLSRMLREHTDKGDPRDVANFCMFLWCLGQPIAAAPAAPAVDAPLTDDEIEGEFNQAGGKWTGDYWKIEDADLHPYARRVEQRAVLAERERICAAIKSEDDHCATGDYMLDSDDCIKVVRGEWERPVYDAHPAAQAKEGGA